MPELRTRQEDGKQVGEQSGRQTRPLAATFELKITTTTSSANELVSFFARSPARPLGVVLEKERKSCGQQAGGSARARFRLAARDCLQFGQTRERSWESSVIQLGLGKPQDQTRIRALSSRCKLCTPNARQSRPMQIFAAADSPWLYIDPLDLWARRCAKATLGWPLAVDQITSGRTLSCPFARPVNELRTRLMRPQFESRRVAGASGRIAVAVV